MKKDFVFLVLFLMAFVAYAQSPDMWNNIRFSSSTPDDTIYVRCETANNLVDTKMYYSTENGWGESSLQNIIGTTFQGAAHFNNQLPVSVRYRSMLDTFVVMQSAYMLDDVSTPNYQKLGYVADDPQGDNLMVGVDNLDIASTYFANSDTRIYAGMSNFVEDYPLHNGGYVPTEFYFYVGMIFNPETVWQDTIMYAMVTAEVPMLFESGLYKIHGTSFTMDTITRIGDISYDNNQDALVMSCMLDDIVQDEDFGDWPNFSNSLGYTFLTFRTGLEGTVSMGDYSKTSSQIFEHFIIQPFENHLPTITDANAITGVSNTNIAATYTDEDNNFPLYSKAIVHRANAEDTQYELTAAGFDYASGVNFVAQIPETEWDYIIVKFSDNNSDFIQETIYPQSSHENTLQQTYNVKVYPNPISYLSGKTSVKISYNVSAYPDAKIYVYNLKGQRVDMIKNSQTGNAVWNISGKNISTGIYLYKIKTKNRETSGKIVVIK